MPTNEHSSNVPSSRRGDKSLIVLATVAETVRAIQNEKLSQSDIEATIRKAAVGWGARGDLFAVLMRRLPQLFIEVQSANLDATESDILLPVKPQYETWTQGWHKFVKDISTYEEKKDQYLFWADITNGEYKSFGKQKRPLSAPARRLLLCLAENMGMSVLRSEVFKRVIEISPDRQEGWKSRLAHYLTELQKFSGAEFRNYLPPPDRFTDTFTLRKSFKNKYFVFVTWKSSE